MNGTLRRASEADAEVLSLLNADVQSLHATALPEHFKPLGPDTFPATVARTLLVNPSNFVFIAEVDSEPAGYAYAEVVHLPNRHFATPGTRSICTISACGRPIEERASPARCSTPCVPPPAKWASVL